MSFTPLDSMDPEAKERRKKMEKDIEEARNKDINDDQKEEERLSFTKNELIELIESVALLICLNVALWLCLFLDGNKMGFLVSFFLGTLNSFMTGDHCLQT